MRARASARAAIVVVLGVGLWVLGSGDAKACECLATGSACAVAPKATAVFVGRVFGRAQGDVLFDVERAVRGVKKGRIRLDSGSGNCVFPFRDGERYIVYAHWDDQLKMLGTSICSRTRPLDDPHARADLAYFDHVPAGVISGVVWDTTTANPLTSFVAPRPMAGVIVSASAQERRTRTTSTGADGGFLFKGLPPGTWTLTAKVPSEFIVPDPRSVTIPDKDQCAEADLATHRVGTGAPR